jgi:outer membrane receptor protein involved in Fe transport
MRHKYRRLYAGSKECCYVFMLAIAMATNLPLMAQFTTARLSGSVVDGSAAAVAGATVTVKNVAMGYTQSTTSGAAGEYLFPGLPVGAYQLTVTMNGFSPYVQNGLVLTVNQAATQNVALQVGQLLQQVTVQANSSMVTTESPTVGQLINQQSITGLPLNGRDVQQLVFLIPGAVNVSAQNCGSNCQGGVIPGEQYAKINGGGSNGVYYLLDGVDFNDTYINTNMPFPNPDAIQEFNIQTDNMSAVYGNATGGVVNVVTKSGADQIHGDAFEFLRNYALDARNYFASSPDPLKQNQFGGAIGGPILKNKLFYFGSYQGTRTNTTANGQVAFVPTAAERTGDFSDLLPGAQLVNPNTGVPFINNQIPAADLNPVALYVLQHIPLPNGPDRQLTYNGAPLINNTDEYTAKADYNLGKHHLSGHYFQINYNVPLVSPASADVNVLETNTNDPQKLVVKHVSVVDIYTISSNFLLNSYFGYTSEDGTTYSPVPFSMGDAGANVAQPVKSGPGVGPVISLSVGGGFSIGNVPYGVWNHGDLSLREVATLVKGQHELSFGGELLRIRLPMGHTYLESGQFGFSNNLSGDNTADFLLGQMSNFAQGGGYYLNFTGNNWSAFVQDNWKVSPRLTVSAGLRWDPFYPYTDTLGRVACFVPGAQSTRYPNSPQGLLFGGSKHDAGCPASSIYNNPYNFGPRLGFASQLTSDGKTSLRGGAGYYYEEPNTVWLQDIVGIPPFSPTVNLTDVSLTDPYGSAGVANPFPAQFGPRNPGPDATFPPDLFFYSIFDRHFRLAQVLTWNLTLERGFGQSWLARVAYMGNEADRLTGTGDQEDGMLQLNPAVYIPGQSTEANTQERRIYPAFGNINSIDSGVNGSYHALQLTLERRFTHGLSFLANYTWARALDDFGPAGGSGTNSCSCGRYFDYGPDTGDVNKVFRVSGLYMLPHLPGPGLVNKVVNGWQVTGIANWQSGFPFSIFSNDDNSFSAIGADRADLTVPSVKNALLSTGRPHAQLTQEWFDTSAFAANAIGTFGDTGKNILRGPRYFDTDLALLKNTNVTERVSLQFRAEFYNALNNVNFGMPDGGLMDSGFGQITSAQSPRIMQLALKANF